MDLKRAEKISSDLSQLKVAEHKLDYFETAKSNALQLKPELRLFHDWGEQTVNLLLIEGGDAAYMTLLDSIIAALRAKIERLKSELETL